MWTRQYRKSKLRFAMIPLAAAAMLAYFGFHSINGTLGMNSSKRYGMQIAELTTELGKLQAVRSKLEVRTSLLSDGSLDQDLIDQQSRQLLGLSNPGELIMLHSSN